MLSPMLLSGVRRSTELIAFNTRGSNMPHFPNENDAQNSSLYRYFHASFKAISSRKQSPKLYHEKNDFFRGVNLVPYDFERYKKLEIYSVFNSIVTILLSIYHLKRPLQGAWIIWDKLNLRG